MGSTENVEETASKMKEGIKSVIDAMTPTQLEEFAERCFVSVDVGDREDRGLRIRWKLLTFSFVAGVAVFLGISAFLSGDAFSKAYDIFAYGAVAIIAAFQFSSIIKDLAKRGKL